MELSPGVRSVFTSRFMDPASLVKMMIDWKVAPVRPKIRTSSASSQHKIHKLTTKTVDSHHALFSWFVHVCALSPIFGLGAISPIAIS